MASGNSIARGIVAGARALFNSLIRAWSIWRGSGVPAPGHPLATTSRCFVSFRLTNHAFSTRMFAPSEWVCPGWIVTLLTPIAPVSTQT